MYKFFAIAAGILLAVTGYGAFDLVEAGRAGSVIVIPAKASKYERFAAEELQEFARKISGATLEIVSEDTLPAGPAVIIGNHPANAGLAAELESKCGGSYDRFAWRVKDDKLHFSSPTGDGIAWAVWDWLEKTQGVAFLMPGKYGTYWPSAKTLHAADGTTLERPALAFRSYSIGVPKFMQDDTEHGLPVADIFRYRQRFNMWTTLDPADTYGWLGSGHSYAHYLPIERYGKEHPEWYAMQNGVRRTSNEGGFWQLCLSNTESPAVFAANTVVEIENLKKQGIPESRILLCTVPNDLGGWCECPECLALRDPDKTWSSAVLRYTNAVADQIALRYPELKVLHFVYHDYGRIPTLEKPRGNVYICITAWSSRDSLSVDMTAGMFDPKKNPICRSVFDWFSANSKGVMNYGYYGHYEHFTPWPMIDQIASDMKTLTKSPNGFGSYSESHLHWGTQAPNFYIHGKLMWDASRDPYELLDEFCRKAYGPAAKEAGEYFRILQRQMNSLTGICGTGAEIPSIISPEVIAQCNKTLAPVARKLAQMDEATRWRTQLLLDAWRVSVLYADALRLLNYASTPDARQQILANIEQIDAYAVSDNGQMAFEYPMLRIALDQVRSGAGLDLQAVPLGESARRGHLMWGSTIKFWAACTNIRADMWGFYMPNGGKAELVLPLKTVAGAKFSKVKVKATTEGKVETFAVGSDGVERRFEADVPAGALGSSDLRLIFRITLPEGKAGYGLTALDLDFVTAR